MERSNERIPASTWPVGLWEGVASYLTPGADDTTVRWAHHTTGEGSELAFTYVHRGLLDGTVAFPHSTAWVRSVADAGEPFVFGFDPADLPPTCGARLDPGRGRLDHGSPDPSRARPGGGPCLLPDRSRAPLSPAPSVCAPNCAAGSDRRHQGMGGGAPFGHHREACPSTTSARPSTASTTRSSRSSPSVRSRSGAAAGFKADDAAVRAPDRRAALLARVRERATAEGADPDVVAATYHRHGRCLHRPGARESTGRAGTRPRPRSPAGTTVRRAASRWASSRSGAGRRPRSARDG